MDHQTYEAFSWKIASAYLKTAPQNSCICPAGLYLLLPTISDEASGKAKEELELLLPGVSSQDAGELHRLLGACPAIQSRAQVLLPTQPGEENPYELRLREIFGDALHTQASEDHSLTMIHHIDFKDDWKKRFTETVGTFYPTPENSRSIPFIRQDAAAVNHRETNAFISVAIPFSAGGSSRPRDRT